jgi:hypothetical protein
LATSLSALADPVGSAFGMAVFNFFIEKDPDTDFRSEMLWCSIWVGVIYTALIIAAMVFIREKPPTAPR